VRLVRDSFTMPEPDFALIAALKARTMAAQRETKKSELLRAGLHVLMALDDDTLIGSLGRLQPLKLGRPKKNH
jgi:predicted N-acetyltransferase YhbS